MGLSGAGAGGAPGFAAGVTQRARGGLSRPKPCQSSGTSQNARASCLATKKAGTGHGGDNRGHLACAVQSMQTPGHVQQIISRCRFHRDPGGIRTERLQLQQAAEKHLKGSFHSSAPLRFVLETEREAGIVMLQSCAEVIWGVVFISFTANSREAFPGKNNPGVGINGV